MTPIEATGWSSKMGVQLSPPLTDFQTPPAAPPAYMMSVLDSTTSVAGRRAAGGPPGVHDVGIGFDDVEGRQAAAHGGRTDRPGGQAGEQVRIDRLGGPGPAPGPPPRGEARGGA